MKNETKDYQFNVTTVGVSGHCFGGVKTGEQTLNIE